MASRSWRHSRIMRQGFVALIMAAVLSAGAGRSHLMAQESVGAPAGEAGAAARGKYIVEDVAMCGTCHTPRLPNGHLDHSRWLAGAPVPYLPASPTPDWPLYAPRLAGNPPANDVGMVTLLTTGVWITGSHLRAPMPQFRMTPSDAQAVVAYLKAVKSKP